MMPPRDMKSLPLLRRAWAAVLLLGLALPVAADTTDITITGGISVIIIGDGGGPTLDTRTFVPAHFLIPSGVSLGLQVRNLADKEPADTLTFEPEAGGTYAVSRQYIEMAVSSNYPSWAVSTYTDNGYAAADSADAWGAMIGEDTANRIPLLWAASDDFVSETLSVPSIDDTIVAASGWVWYIDKGDWNYARIVSDTGTMYTTVLFGTPTALNFNFGFGGDVTSPLALYVAAPIAGAKPDRYATRLHFDLLHL